MPGTAHRQGRVAEPSVRREWRGGRGSDRVERGGGGKVWQAVDNRLSNIMAFT